MARMAIVVLSLLLIASTTVGALTVDEIIKLKKAGVGDATIEWLYEHDGTAKAAGTWHTKDGWVVHSTDTREPQTTVLNGEQSSYPLSIYPQVGWRGRR
jgi:hypothetical protein